MRNVTVGQYMPFDTFLNRLDPRVKLVGSLTFIISIFFVESFYAYIPIGIVIGILMGLSKVPMKYFIRSMKPVIRLMIITGIINIFTTPGRTLFTIGSLTVTFEGLSKTFFLVLRLALIIIATSLLTYTTSPMNLTYGLEKLLSPLKRFNFPASELAMMVSISLRFIPTLYQEAEKIRLAQMSRGADFESGNVVNRAKNMVPLLVPLFINSFKRSDELATAMEARMYRIGEPRTRLHEINMTKTDVLSLVLFEAFCAFLIFGPF